MSIPFIGRWGRLILVAGLALLVAYALLTQSPPATAEASPEDSAQILLVTGEGRVQAEPDQATINLGVQTRATTAAEAIKQNAGAMNTLLQALKAQGIADQHIQTQGYTVYEDLRYENNATKPSGFVVVNRLQVTVTQLDKLGAIIDAAAQAGSNLMEGIRFALSPQKQQNLEKQALEAAMAHAKKKAEILAQSGKVRLGKVISIEERGTASPPILYREEAARTVDSVTPIQSGMLEYAVQVEVGYELH